MILQHLVSKITLTPEELERAAVNGSVKDDGSPLVAVVDARLILQFLVKKISEFPVERNM